MTDVLTVTFAVREGVVCAQRVRGCHLAPPHVAIVKARQLATKKGHKVANWLTITHKGVLLADYVQDTAARLRGRE